MREVAAERLYQILAPVFSNRDDVKDWRVEVSWHSFTAHILVRFNDPLYFQIDIEYGQEGVMVVREWVRVVVVGIYIGSQVFARGEELQERLREEVRAALNHIKDYYKKMRPVFSRIGEVVRRLSAYGRVVYRAPAEVVLTAGAVRCAVWGLGLAGNQDLGCCLTAPLPLNPQLLSLVLSFSRKVAGAPAKPHSAPIDQNSDREKLRLRRCSGDGVR